MTCIVGVLDKENDCVYIGADSLASKWSNKALIKNKKVFKAKDNKNILMGICGLIKLINFLSVEDKFVEEIKELKNEVNLEHIIKYTSPRIVSLARQYECCNTKDGIPEIQGNVMFAYKNQLYVIEECGQVIELMDNYASIGSGENFAMAVLSQNEDKNIIDRIKEALEAAEKHGKGVERPFYILNTKNDEVIEIS